MPEPAIALETFERHRNRLFGVAYRMLGSVEDAEDILQEVYLRWHDTDRHDVGAPEGWLLTVTTRIAIDRLRRASLERKQYVGPWLPEPVATGRDDSADRRAELSSDLSLAFLVLLERLAPEERAALLLRDVFDADYGEIARVLERSEAASRHRLTSINGEPAIASYTGDRLRFITSVVTDGDRFLAFYRVLNPDKLRRIADRLD